MPSNPYRPPESNIERIAPPSKRFLNVVAVLGVLQLLLFAKGLPRQFNMLSAGEISLPPILFDFISNVLLVIGGIFLVWKNRGQNIYLISGLLLLPAAYFARNFPYLGQIPVSIYSTEIMLSFFGWFVIYRYRKNLLRYQAQSTPETSVDLNPGIQ